ncbi:hemerythrin-like domain-containing protein [Motilibacter peucedani]|uniref:Hemerythrin-like domain-containing protein n=1 Tax=Motilibacter peucedani TaxID=598650 RepID=A0A420XRF0_9ACTN|nr:hemerythrin domain-containing protein [Motilibacter peucedani]RKS77458.1 hemerythrin-like domain-containing protein [Motilibacter peucedani]
MTESTVQRDVIDILTEDHREFLTLVAGIKVAQDGEEKRDLTDTLIAELVRHAVAEEMYVYPAMKKHLPDGAEAVEHDTKEHKELEATMKKLEGDDSGSTEFLEHLGELEEILRDHVDDEESDQFPKLRANIPAAELVEMGEKVVAAKEAAPTRPHPLAPNNAVFHKLVGPGVGFVDRLRDKLTGRNQHEEQL